MNAKLEFLNVTESNKLLCSTITISYDWNGGTTFNLKPGYTPEEYDLFINNLDFDYDDGFGSQHLFGTIWCDNGVWFDRHEYDGSEYWDFHKYPIIPALEQWGADVVIIDYGPEVDSAGYTEEDRQNESDLNALENQGDEC